MEAGEAGARTGDFEFTDRDFRFIARFIGEHAGIVLSDAKRDLVYGRLQRRLRALGLRRFSDYCELLEQGDGEELEHFVNALTTNLTSFFREPHHFEYLQKDLLPRLLRERSERRLRIWSAGCSTGEEPYSIAMVVAETVPEDWDVRILATDLDTNVVATAAAGRYGADRVEGISEARRRRWFLRGKGANQGMVRVRPELQELIRFRPLNLLDPWPMRGAFDIIFCRNVVIYFDKSTQRVLFDRFAGQMRPDGHLFIGHSETLHKVSERFQLLGNTIYRRVG
ncbi:CheR family methyltransferase [Thioalkalivibrio sulfidiphilus]|uniref:CheR family methyltransferase n=1 Tax=Thioalkalivibrio sulfidiphilus TaxID=1033854 RepID=UPI00036D444C|nr:protein-glutamate O-methyltransferase CheR [Thioalkalivibrio sulfidiphilus]